MRWFSSVSLWLASYVYRAGIRVSKVSSGRYERGLGLLILEVIELKTGSAVCGQGKVIA